MGIPYRRRKQRRRVWLFCIICTGLGGLTLGVGIGSGNTIWWLGGIALSALGFYIKHKEIDLPYGPYTRR